MRINKYVAQSTGLSRRAADRLIEDGEIIVNGQRPQPGLDVSPTDKVTHNGKLLQALRAQTIMLNKPPGYVVSRDGQGSMTIYDLLPPELHHLKPVGRLDKYSSGLLLLTNDGELAQSLTHPSQQKLKIYEVTITRPLAPLHRQMISDIGIQLDDGDSTYRSTFNLERIEPSPTTTGDASNDNRWRIHIREGHNRQIRRTFKALGYHVSQLRRTHFGDYILAGLTVGKHRQAMSRLLIVERSRTNPAQTNSAVTD